MGKKLLLLLLAIFVSGCTYVRPITTIEKNNPELAAMVDIDGVKIKLPPAKNLEVVPERDRLFISAKKGAPKNWILTLFQTRKKDVEKKGITNWRRAGRSISIYTALKFTEEEISKSEWEWHGPKVLKKIAGRGAVPEKILSGDAIYTHFSRKLRSVTLFGQLSMMLVKGKILFIWKMQRISSTVKDMENFKKRSKDDFQNYLKQIQKLNQ